MPNIFVPIATSLSSDSRRFMRTLILLRGLPPLPRMFEGQEAVVEFLMREIVQRPLSLSGIQVYALAILARRAFANPIGGDAWPITAITF